MFKLGLNHQPECSDARVLLCECSGVQMLTSPPLFASVGRRNRRGVEDDYLAVINLVHDPVRISTSPCCRRIGKHVLEP